MKHILLIVFLFSGLNLVNGQGIEFFQGTWKEALEEAKKQDKIIFVDAYAVWCGPCKKMAKNVFTKKKVGDFYNKNFLNVKLDMEKGEGMKFRQKYPVSAFPTLFFIDYTGELVLKMKGAQQVEPLIKLGKSALSKIDRSKEYAVAYESGDRSPELVYNYVKALNQAGKPSLKIANEYLSTQKNLDTKENLAFILVAASEADSRIFNLLIDKRKQLEAIHGASAVAAQIEKACRNTAEKAIEFESEDLLEEATAKMKKHCPEKATAFTYNMEMDFCEKMGNSKEFVKACHNYAKKIAKNDSEQLYTLVQDLERNFPNDTKAMAEAESLAAKAVKYSDSNYKYYHQYAYILHKNGKKTAALKAADQALSMAKESEKRAVQKVQRLIDMINS